MKGFPGLPLQVVAIGLLALGGRGDAARERPEAGSRLAGSSRTLTLRLPHPLWQVQKAKVLLDEARDRLYLLCPSAQRIRCLSLRAGAVQWELPLHGDQAAVADEGSVLANLRMTEGQSGMAPAEDGKVALAAVAPAGPQILWWRAGGARLMTPAPGNRLFVLTPNDAFDMVSDVHRWDFEIAYPGDRGYLALIDAVTGWLGWSSDIGRPIQFLKNVDMPGAEEGSALWVPFERRLYHYAGCDEPLYLAYWPAQAADERDLLLYAVEGGILAFDPLLGGIQWALPAFPWGSRFAFCGPYAVSTSTQPRPADPGNQYVYWIDRQGNQEGKFDAVADEQGPGTLGTWWLGAAGNAFIAQVDGRLWSYDVVEDRRLWKSEVSFEEAGVHYGGDLVHAGVAYGIAEGWGAILGVDAGTGKLVWEEGVEGEVRALTLGERCLVAYVIPAYAKGRAAKDETVVSLRVFQLPADA